MPKVLHTYQIERQAINHVKTILTNFEWVVEEIEQDFGEDLYIKIPIDEKIGTYNSLKVQVKGTESPTYGKNHKDLKCSFKIDHLTQWVRNECPILICVVDLLSEDRICLWRMIDEEIEDKIIDTNIKTVTLNFPFRNQLEFEQSKVKIAAKVFWFYQDGYDLSTRKGQRVREIVEENIRYLLKEIPEIAFLSNEKYNVYPWEDMIEEFKNLLDWLTQHKITKIPVEWTFAHAKLYYIANKPEKCIQIVQSIERESLNEDNVFQVNWLIILSLLDMHENIEAEKKLENLVNTFPEVSVVWTHLGIVQRRLDKHQEAIESHKTALKLDSDSLDSYASLGGCYRDVKEYEKALFILEKGLSINEDYFPVLFALAALKKDLKRYNEALAHYEAIKAKIQYINTSDAIICTTGLAAVYRKVGRFEEAINSYEFVLKYDSNNIYALNGLGWVFIDIGNYTKAEEMFLRVLKLNPNSNYAKVGLRSIARFKN